MKGDTKVIEFLNAALKGELTAINQYWLHYRTLDNLGITRLAAHARHESIDEMKHADELIKRILFLEGLPNLQKLDRIRIGQTVQEVMEADLSVENEAVPHLKNCIKLAEAEADYVTRNLFLHILESEEEHVDWLETQLTLLKQIGVQNFIQSQIEMESGK